MRWKDCPVRHDKLFLTASCKDPRYPWERLGWYSRPVVVLKYLHLCEEDLMT